MYFKKVPRFITQLFPGAIWTSEGKPELKWTFDDGPHPESTPQLLALLNHHKIKATFFCQGENAERYPELMLEILQRGHTIGNHGYKHTSGWGVRTSAYIANINAGRDCIDSNYYRPPYGRLTFSQYKAISDQGMQVVFWNRMPGDFDKRVSQETLYKNIINHTSEGCITVLHDNPKYSSKVLYALSRYFEHQS